MSVAPGTDAGPSPARSGPGGWEESLRWGAEVEDKQQHSQWPDTWAWKQRSRKGGLWHMQRTPGAKGRRDQSAAYLECQPPPGLKDGAWGRSCRITERTDLLPDCFLQTCENEFLLVEVLS